MPGATLLMLHGISMRAMNPEMLAFAGGRNPRRWQRSMLSF
jgi:hypothetical protein